MGNFGHNNNNNKDIKIKNKKVKTCTLIDVAIPADRNAVRRKQKRMSNTRVYV
jgi:hypothetical protein